MNNEPKIIKRWIDDDHELKKHYRNFMAWFKSFRDRGGRIGQEIDKRNGEIYLLSYNEFIVLKEHYLKRNKGWSK